MASFLLKGSSGGPFDAKETFFHHPPEIRGPGFAGGPIVRDRNAALVDPDEWSQPADPDRLERRYYATDWQGRVVALVTAAGEQAESYRYTANGVPIGIPLGDVNGDGKVEVGASEEDWQQAYWWENNFGPYDARLDLNLDGSVNATDIGLVGSQTPGTMPTARASAASVGNRMFASARVDREAVLGREGDFRWDQVDLLRRICIAILEAQLERLRPTGDSDCGKPKLLGKRPWVLGGRKEPFRGRSAGLQTSVRLSSNPFFGDDFEIGTKDEYIEASGYRQLVFSDERIEARLKPVNVRHRVETYYPSQERFNDTAKWQASCDNQCNWNIVCKDMGRGCRPYVGRAGPGGIPFEDADCQPSEKVTGGLTAGNTGVAKAGSVLTRGYLADDPLTLEAMVTSRVSWGQSVSGRVFKSVGIQITGPGGVGPV